MLRPGDRFEAEVYRVRELKAGPPHVQESFRIVTLNVNIPRRTRTYFATVSWSLEKMGREPRLGDSVMIEYTEPPFQRRPLEQGKFRIVHLTGNATDAANIGTVTWQPNHQAVYCRIQLDREGSEIPLSIKATFSGFDRRRLIKGVKVEVARSCRDDARRYHIVRILDIENPCGEIHLETKEHCDMGHTEDRVRFFMGYKYLQHNKIYGVLTAAFGIPEHEARDLYRMQANGFWIICRPDQFARFMIYRNNAGMQNGFMDLKPELIQPCGDVYSRIAKAAGVDRCAVKKVLLALSYDEATVEERLEARTAEIDVSENG